MAQFDLLEALNNFRKQQESDLPQEKEEITSMLSFLLFPGGAKQIEEQAGQLHILLQGDLGKEEVKELLVRAKELLLVSENLSEEWMTQSIIEGTCGRLTQDDAQLVYQFVTGISGPACSGRDGSSRGNAVVINAKSSIAGIRAEYDWLEALYGKKGEAWKLKSQCVAQDKAGPYDIFVIELRDGKERTIYFDIGAFFGSF